MKLKAPTLEIPADDPFKNDLLGRKATAEALTELIKSNDDPLVLCINAPWGEGKSTFVGMWRQTLINESFKTLYFNAWENDFSEDAFVSLIGELELGIHDLSLEGGQKDAVQQHLAAAKKFGASIIKRAIPAALKVATAGVLDLSEISEEALADFSARVAEDQIKEYEDAKKSVAGFKEQLREIANHISESEAGKSQPLLIFIDELDRCRPPYAIKVLEAVKHFFSVENVVYILTLDRQQLGHSIRSMYGTDMDVEGYLRRFIDIDYNLPTPDEGAFCKAQFERFGLADFFSQRTKYQELQYDRGHFEKSLSELFAALDFSLREQERAFAALSLAIRSTNVNFPLHPLLLGVLIILKIKKHELYKEFVAGRKGPMDVLEYIRSTPKGSAFLDTSYGIAVEAYLVGCRSDRFDFAELTRPYRETFLDQDMPEQVRQRAQSIIKNLESMSHKDLYGILGYLVKKIDMFSVTRY